jgi:GT2 family glycosyltransferase
MIDASPREMDVIILSYAANENLKRMTTETVASLLRSENPALIRFNVLVVESSKEMEPFQYDGSRTIYPDQRFGYNRYLNIGIRQTSAPFLCLANNDLRFHEGWASAIFAAADADADLLSFSPIDPWLHGELGMLEIPQTIVGYEKMKHVTGWCLVIRRRLAEIVGPFDENLEFWYVDDDYIQTLRSHGIRHALVRDARVDHVSGRTLAEVEQQERRRLTSAQWLYFDYKWNHQSRSLYALKRILYLARNILRSGDTADS